jgi:AbiV family abortive infection protein
VACQVVVTSRRRLLEKAEVAGNSPPRHCTEIVVVESDQFQMQQPSGENEESAVASLDALIDDILNDRVSVFDLMRSAEHGDYWGYVQRKRLFFMLAREPRVLIKLSSEMRERIAGLGGDPDHPEIEKEFARKDGERRFARLSTERVQALEEQPSLLTGANFEECLTQYQVLLAHVEKLWADACQLYLLGNYPLATFVSILVIEEVGKLSRLSWDLMLYDRPRVPTVGSPVERNHRKKHFTGVVSGALINARLDRVLGKDVILRIVHQAESDELERLRQGCLYIDMVDGLAVMPGERIDADRARVLTVLAGEVMAEVLGYFPWEFERMLDNVTAFERQIGIPEKKIVRR